MEFASCRLLIPAFGAIRLSAADSSTLAEASYLSEAGLPEAESDGQPPLPRVFPEDEAAFQHCAVLQSAAGWLADYFRGVPQDNRTLPFRLQLEARGTEFQRRVWRELQAIPYGTTITYKELAERAGCPKGFRAAGGACNKNPFLIFVPCHRVISADGSLRGFACGLGAKAALLGLERRGRAAISSNTPEGRR
ncbi:MAG: methylated-DNA--[protein]-cysteine S-methyltransferase [Treponemataceae bacterium]|nr:methylated-DNA--[protein]-cysteine S-methyltransferase [Treponemataceae bacterium]